MKLNAFRRFFPIKCVVNVMLLGVSWALLLKHDFFFEIVTHAFHFEIYTFILKDKIHIIFNFCDFLIDF